MVNDYGGPSTPRRPQGAYAQKLWDQKYGGVKKPGVEAGAATPTATTTTTPSWTTPTTDATESYSAPAVQASQPTDYWKAATTIEGRKSTTADPKQDPRVTSGTHYVGFGGAILPYGRSRQSAEHGGIVTGNEQYDALTAAEKYDMGRRYGELGGMEGINRGFSEHNAQKAAQQLKQAQGQRAYQDAMQGNWSKDRQAQVSNLKRQGMITHDEYMEGAHDMVGDGQGGYQSQGNTRVGYRPDGTFGWMDSRDYPGWTQDVGQEVYAPSREDLNVAHAQGYDVTNMGRDQAAQIAQEAPQQQMPQWGQPQQQQMPQWGAAPQGTMANQYGWGTGLGGPPQQQQMPQWGQPQQQQQMPQWGQPPQSSQQQQWAMQPWGGQQQQQAMPQWGQMMQQQPMMGGPMAGMEAARMGGGAMQQMGGGSPWASMWGDPFAGRQMTTDPNRPAMGGLPQMDPTQQLMMQMMGGGGGLSGGFGDGGGSSGGGGMSGAGQTGGGADYDGLANILALFAGGGYGGGGGGAAAPTHYGGLPRNGLYYANLMGG